MYCPHDRAALLTMRPDDARCGRLIDGRYLLARIGRGAWARSTGRGRPPPAVSGLKLLADPVAEIPVALGASCVRPG
ncbi:MAG: hypothetical protein R3F43_19575 [bacterium]